MRTLVAAKPERDCSFVACSGHEIGFLGIDAYTQARPDLVARARMWIYFGANIGAPQQPNLIHASDAALVQWTAAAMAREGLDVTGNGERGSITGLFTVLVEADDMNDPIADAVRSILDGHIVLTRELATQNHYPAIDVLESVSRLVRDLLSEEQLNLVAQARETMAIYRRNQDLINIGAYPAGSNAPIDRAIRLREPMEKFLRQPVNQGVLANESWAMLAKLMAGVETPSVSPMPTAK
jgi:hypothetical protein